MKIGIQKKVAKESLETEENIELKLSAPIQGVSYIAYKSK